MTRKGSTVPACLTDGIKAVRDCVHEHVYDHANGQLWCTSNVDVNVLVLADVYGF